MLFGLKLNEMVKQESAANLARRFLEKTRKLE